MIKSQANTATNAQMSTRQSTASGIQSTKSTSRSRLGDTGSQTADLSNSTNLQLMLRHVEEQRKQSLFDPLTCIVGDVRNVTSLHLGNRGLAELHPNIQQLVNLEELFLDTNKLTSLDQLVPEEDKPLEKPAHEKHKRRGCIRLRRLFAFNNKLTSLVGVKQLKHLEVLSVHTNNLRDLDKQLRELRHLVNLRQLSLYENPVSQELNYYYRTIVALPSLQILDNQSISEADRQAAHRALGTVQDASKGSKHKPQMSTVVAFGKHVAPEDMARPEKVDLLSDSVKLIEKETVQIRAKMQAEKIRKQQEEEEERRRNATKEVASLVALSKPKVLPVESYYNQDVVSLLETQSEKNFWANEVVPFVQREVGTNELRKQRLDFVVEQEVAMKWMEHLFSIIPEHKPTIQGSMLFWQFFQLLCQSKQAAADAIADNVQQFDTRLPKENKENEKPANPKDKDPQPSALDEEKRLGRLALRFTSKAIKWQQLGENALAKLKRQYQDSRSQSAATNQRRDLYQGFDFSTGKRISNV